MLSFLQGLHFSIQEIAKASSIDLGILTLDRFVVNARNYRDKLSYDTNLEIECFVHNLTHFLWTIGISSVSKMFSRLPKDERLVPSISSNSR